ncbi:SAV_915 family protein, partial [Streptomyces sp. S6]
ATLGPDQPWLRLAEPALRALALPLGVTAVTVDPRFTAPPPAGHPQRTTRNPRSRLSAAAIS